MTEQKGHVIINFLAEQLGKFKQLFAEVRISLKAELRQKSLKKLKKDLTRLNKSGKIDFAAETAN